MPSRDLYQGVFRLADVLPDCQVIFIAKIDQNPYPHNEVSYFVALASIDLDFESLPCLSTLTIDGEDVKFVEENERRTVNMPSANLLWQYLQESNAILENAHDPNLIMYHSTITIMIRSSERTATTSNTREQTQTARREGTTDLG